MPYPIIIIPTVIFTIGLELVVKALCRYIFWIPNLPLASYLWRDLFSQQTWKEQSRDNINTGTSIHVRHSFKNQTGSVVRPEKTWTEGLTSFLRVTGPTNKKPEKLHKNNVFSRGYDPET
jgi:hypothetical protein